MHEMSIAEGLMEQILSIANENSLKSIEEVEIETGLLRQVIPEVMQEAFRAVRQDTIAQSAVLKITEIPAIGKCRTCQKEFEPELNNFLCPQCLRADVEILQGDDIILKSVIGEREAL